MSYAMLVIASLAMAPNSGEAVPMRRGLSEAGSEKLANLLSAKDDAEQFKKRLQKLVEWGDFQAVVVLTHAMMELPWDEKLAPRFRYDTRMPKLAVERALDNLVGAQHHDKLSAAYFRAALGKRGDLDTAKKNLLDWTLDHHTKLNWSDGKFWLQD